MKIEAFDPRAYFAGDPHTVDLEFEQIHFAAFRLAAEFEEKMWQAYDVRHKYSESEIYYGFFRPLLRHVVALLEQQIEELLAD